MLVGGVSVTAYCVYRYVDASIECAGCECVQSRVCEWDGGDQACQKYFAVEYTHTHPSPVSLSG